MLVVLGGSGQGSPATAARAPKSKPTPPARVSWILEGSSLQALREHNAGLARRFFDNPETFVIGTAGDQNMVPQGYRAIPTRAYTSLRAFETDLHYGRIAPPIGAVIYDPEAWARTPIAEQHAPVAAMRRFARLAGKWGYGQILAPGRDLALGDGACAKRDGELLDAAYLRCGLTGGAIGAEDFVIQAAPVELAVGRLHRLLRGARSQLRRIAPDVGGFASLSTDPPESTERLWPIDLLRAARLELAHVPGLMFNFNPQTVDLAASFLRDLEREDPVNGMLVSRG